MGQRHLCSRVAVLGLLCFGIVAFVGGSADAAVLLQFDLNSVQLQCMSGVDGTGGPVGFPGTSYTGSLHLSKSANSLVASMRVDGVTQDGSGGSDTFAGTLDS